MNAEQELAALTATPEVHKLSSGQEIQIRLPKARNLAGLLAAVRRIKASLPNGKIAFNFSVASLILEKSYDDVAHVLAVATGLSKEQIDDMDLPEIALLGMKVATVYMNFLAQMMAQWTPSLPASPAQTGPTAAEIEKMPPLYPGQ